MLTAKNHRRKIFFGLVVFCLLAAFLVWRVWFGADKDLATITPAELLERVGALVVLPSDEEPTIATVTDLTELQKQEFFYRAKVGDKVIVYPEAGKAILYSPTENKIVEMAPLNKNLITP